MSSARVEGDECVGVHGFGGCTNILMADDPQGQCDECREAAADGERDAHEAHDRDPIDYDESDWCAAQSERAEAFWNEY